MNLVPGASGDNDSAFAAIVMRFCSCLHLWNRRKEPSHHGLVHSNWTKRKHIPSPFRNLTVRRISVEVV